MQKSKSHITQLIELNFAMVLMSTSGALGRYITLPPPLTIWWRCFLASIFLGLFCWFWKVNLNIHTRRDIAPIVIGAVLLGTHWITYFFSLQYSSVAIGMLSLFTYPAMTAFLEPLVLKTKFQLSHVLLAVLVLAGIYFLAPQFNFHNDHSIGVALGLLSAFLYSLRNVLLKKRTQTYPGSALMLFQLIVITVVFSPTLLLFPSGGMLSNWPAVVTLALVTTAIGHTLFVMSFKHFSISTASIISSTQPIYGIALGIIFLNEIPEWNTIIGGALILISVVIESIRSFR